MHRLGKGGCTGWFRAPSGQQMQRRSWRGCRLTPNTCRSSGRAPSLTTDQRHHVAAARLGLHAQLVHQLNQLRQVPRVAVAGNQHGKVELPGVRWRRGAHLHRVTTLPGSRQPASPPCECCLRNAACAGTGPCASAAAAAASATARELQPHLSYRVTQRLHLSIPCPARLPRVPRLHSCQQLLHNRHVAVPHPLCWPGVGGWLRLCCGMAQCAAAC